MAIAVISDIHSNLEALEAVLHDRDLYQKTYHDLTATYCLGDIIDYGADPEACILLVQKECNIVLTGNHECALLGKNYSEKGIAQFWEESFMPATEWTRWILFFKDKKISSTKEEFLKRKRPNYEHSIPPYNNNYFRYLNTLPEIHMSHEYAFAHASPEKNKHTDEHIDLQSFEREKCVQRLNLAFEAIKKLCFIGHTHIPRIITQVNKDENKNYEARTPIEEEYLLFYKLGKKTIINVGSVGQPRNYDNRASYVIIRNDGIYFRKVSYDIQRAANKIISAGIDKFQAERLFSSI